MRPGAADSIARFDCRAFVLSKRLTSVGTWPTLRSSERAILGAKIMKVYRSMLLLNGSTTHTTDAEIPAIHHLPSPSDIILAEQVSLLCRTVESGAELLKLSLSVAIPTRMVTLGHAGPRSWLPDILASVDRLVCRRNELHDLRGLDPAQF